MREESRKALVALIEANGGTITEDQVIDAARPADSPLHGEFPWDINEAAMEHWRHTARVLIRSVRVVQGESRVLVPAKRVPLMVRNPDDAGYVTIAKLKTNVDRAREAAVNELSHALSALRRARTVCRELGFEGELQETLDAVTRLEVRISDQAQGAA